MREYGLQVYYNNPQPHVTIAWALGDILPKLKVVEGVLQTPCTVEVHRVECKIGKFVYEYDLLLK